MGVDVLLLATDEEVGVDDDGPAADVGEPGPRLPHRHVMEDLVNGLRHQDLRLVGGVGRFRERSELALVPRIPVEQDPPLPRRDYREATIVEPNDVQDAPVFVLRLASISPMVVVVR